jgi:hypothetical protein
MGVTVVQPDAMCIFGLTPKPPQGLGIAAARIVGPSLPILVDLHRGSTECRASEKSVVTAGYFTLSSARCCIVDTRQALIVCDHAFRCKTARWWAPRVRKLRHLCA